MLQRFIYVTGALVLGVTVFISGVSVGRDSHDSTQTRTLPHTSPVIHVLIDADGEVLHALPNISFNQGESLLAILKRLQDERKLQFSYKKYGTMGAFIVSIDGVGEGGSAIAGKWWQYWVNGVYASVGVSSYIPKDDETILFKYTTPQTFENNRNP